MTTKTTTELATEVLRHMTVLGAYDDISEYPNESAYVIDKYNAKYAMLCAPPDELAYWDKAAIPEEIFLTIRDLIANECMAFFGKPMNAADKEASDQIIMRQLRRHVATKHSGHRVQADYF